MSTSLDRKYNRTVHQAMEHYKTAMKTSYTDTRLKYARNALEYFEKSYEYAQYIDLPKHKKEIQEYIAVCHDLKGQSLFEKHDYDAAAQAFQQALTENADTPKSKKKIIRKLIFLKDLTETYYHLDDPIALERTADRLFKLNKKTPDMEERIEYYLLLTKYYIKDQHWRKVDKIYRKLRRLCRKKSVKTNFAKTRADIYANHARYLHKYRQDTARMKKSCDQATAIYREIQLPGKIEKLRTDLGYSSN